MAAKNSQSWGRWGFKRSRVHLSAVG